MPTESTPTWFVGHDGSANASHAAHWAIAHAADHDVDVCLVRAWQIPAIDSPMPVGAIDRFAPEHACGDIEALRSAAVANGVGLRESIVRSAPTTALLDTSETGAALVVGSRGLGGFRRLLLGSISSQCATHARVPTIVVPDSAETRRPMRRIVVGLDGSERSRRALAWAQSFAPDGCSILVVGAWMPSRSGYLAVVQHYTNEIEAAREQFNRILDELNADTGSTRVERHFAYQDPATTLLEMAEGADLLVVGQRGHSGLSAAVLGSVTTHVLHHSSVPVAVIPVDD